MKPDRPSRRFSPFGLGALIAGLTAGCQSPSEPASSPPTTAASAESGTRAPEVLPAHFQATVYEVQASPERVGALDARALARQADTVDKLLRALGKVGTARTLYRVDQLVNVLAERITVGAREPLVAASRTDPRGQAIRSVQYQNVGLIVLLSGPEPPDWRQHPNVKMSLELSTLTPSGVEVAPGTKAMTVRTVSLEHQEPLEFGQARLALSVSSASLNDQAAPVVYVVRYLFSRPNSR